MASFESRVAGGDRGFADVALAAHFLEVDACQADARDFLDGEAQDRFGHSAAGAEDHAGARLEAQRHVERLRLQLPELQSGLLDHQRQFLRGQHVVDVGPTVGLELGQLGLVLLGRAGHDRDDDQVLRFHVQCFGQRRAGQRAEHLLRRTAARQVRQHFGAELFGELDPGRTARGELRQAFARRFALQELGGLFDDRQIGRETGVVDLVKPERLHGGDETPRLDAARLQAERLADPHADRRSDLDDHGLVGIVQGAPDRVDLGLRGQGAGRTDRGAEPAIDAFAVGQVLAERRTDRRLRAPVDEVDRSDALDFAARPDAVAAQDALVRDRGASDGDDRSTGRCFCVR